MTPKRANQSESATTLGLLPTLSGSGSPIPNPSIDFVSENRGKYLNNLMEAAMRYFEMMKAARVIAPKTPKDPESEAERQAKVRAAVDKARSRTQKAAQVYSDQMQADDDAEREAKKRL